MPICPPLEFGTGYVYYISLRLSLQWCRCVHEHLNLWAHPRMLGPRPGWWFDRVASSCPIMSGMHPAACSHAHIMVRLEPLTLGYFFFFVVITPFLRSNIRLYKRLTALQRRHARKNIGMVLVRITFCWCVTIVAIIQFLRAKRKK